MQPATANLLLPIALGVVLVILVVGLWNMMRGGSASRSQNLMRARVIAQFAAIVVAMAALWLSGR
jgi:cytochrome c biogenesis factor